MLDYGIVGNCMTCALIKKNGSVDWMCFPSFSSPSVFAKILDEKKGGSFSVVPQKKCRIKQKYLKHTNVLETSYNCKDYSFKVTDFFPRYKMVIGKNRPRLVKENKLIRIVKLVRGEPQLKVKFDPKLNYAISKTKLAKKNVKHIEISDHKNKMLLTTNLRQDKLMNSETFTLKKDLYFVFGNKECSRDYDLERCNLLLKSTTRYWRGWVKNLVLPRRNKEMIIRSALCLKLLTYSKTGAMIAAATTSIPEEVKSKRTWDYRFCWVRDSAMTIDALYKIGREYEAKNFMDFIIRRAMKDEYLQIMYGIDGDKRLRERVLKHLDGFRGSKPVRIGNAAYKQLQNDVYGKIIDILYLHYVYYGFDDEIKERYWDFLKFLVDQIKLNWRKKDQGIWEFRNLAEHYTYSKLMCYVGVDRAIKIALHFKKDRSAVKWTRLRDKIRKEIILRGYNKKTESFTIAYGSKNLDASLLLMAYHEFLEPDNPLLVNTVKKIYDDLRTGDIVQRYTLKDDFGLSRSSFTACSFWLIQALTYIGEKQKAKRLFNSLIKKSNHLGLFSEDIDIKSKKLTGNFPQAYTHVALINTSILLSEWSAKRKKINWAIVNRKKWF